MNFFITYGTLSFLQQIQNKHEDRNLLIFAGEGQAIILEETDLDTIFQQPNEYRVMSRTGDLSESDFQVLITIPTSEDHKYQLEKQLETYQPALDENPDYHSYRLLKSTHQNVYKVLLGFTTRNAYDDYKKSSAFRNNLSLEATKPLAGASAVHTPYIEQYFYPSQDVSEEEIDL
ncbi:MULTISPECIES: signal transduction protein TRAP [unclassified Staphylococcus]|uniref:signal transduction protein TRAP n=1 Tax=unclassified Staphylococcus TaxID=91994 RepID=UPI0021CEFBFC|nr:MULTISPECIES: signal transduction protein TRAP [unclassified Staphylococcus]UXR77679.1 signal transduction protein TRAP [Staphylococcus sp. IVB6227]UXR81836.1 signal transduction protein TRAP [Staphylococcus sp. IVB6214]